MFRRWLWLAIAAPALVLAGCSAVDSATGTASPSASAAAGGLQITIDAPADGASVSSPFELRGRTSLFPSEGNLVYHVYDSTGSEVGSGSIAVAGNIGTPGSFAVLASYATAAAGAGRLEVVAPNEAGGDPIASAAVSVSLAAAGGSASAAPRPSASAAASPPAVASPSAAPSPTATPAPTATPMPTPTPVPQRIRIDTPAPKTIVGSPVVVTGRTTRAPADGQLSYRFVDRADAELGSGTLPVAAQPDGSTTFNAGLTFDLPPDGGSVYVEITDPSSTDGTARDRLELFVNPPQTITIDSPVTGQLVGSPVTISGRTARYPFQGNLAYTVIGPDGRRQREGVFTVQGEPRQPGTFSASLRFDLPIDGGTTRIELTDQDAISGVTAASAAVEVRTAPLPQQIFIDTPAPGTLVGNPVTLTGRTVRLPFQANLGYQAVGPDGAAIGAGIIAVQGAPGTNGSFAASLAFTPPPDGGAISITLYDQDAASGATVATATLALQTNPIRQQVFIDSPPPGTAIGSPVTLTGRVNITPGSSLLSYRMFSLVSNSLIADGVIGVQGKPGSPGTWTAAFGFPFTPGGGPVRILVYDTDPASQQSIGEASIDLVQGGVRPL